MRGGEINASDWIYAAGFAAHSDGAYLAGYSGRVILVDEQGMGTRAYDMGSVPRRIVDTGDYLYLLTDTRLYVLRDDALHALVDTFDGGDVIVAQTAFGLLEKKPQPPKVSAERPESTDDDSSDAAAPRRWPEPERALRDRISTPALEIFSHHHDRHAMVVGEDDFRSFERAVAEVRVEPLRVQGGVEREAGNVAVPGDLLDLVHQCGTTTLPGALRRDVHGPQLRCFQYEGSDPDRFSIQLCQKADLTVGVERQAAYVLGGRRHYPALDGILGVVTRGESPNGPFVNLQIQANFIVPEGANGHCHRADRSATRRRHWPSLARYADQSSTSLRRRSDRSHRA